jgi:hypothetical protein
MLQIPMIPYLGYGVLYRAKKLFGLRANRHRNFLIWKFIRLIESGKIDPRKVSITSMGKTDGAGAQAMAKFSAMCFAHAFGMRYVHEPFANLAHAELPRSEWDAAWENLLQMHAGHTALDRTIMRTVGIGEYLDHPDLWNRDVVISERHYHAFCELAPVHGVEVSKRLQAAFRHRRATTDAAERFIIGVHVRRGDVSHHDIETRHRFTPSQHITSIVEQVLSAVEAAGIAPEIHIHSNGSVEDLADFSRFPNVHFHAGSPALETFADLADSDVLICTRSDFSMLAGIYSPGIVICDPHHRTPLPNWLCAKPGHSGLHDQLSQRLQKPTESSTKF